MSQQRVPAKSGLADRKRTFSLLREIFGFAKTGASRKAAAFMIAFGFLLMRGSDAAGLL